MLRYSYVVVIPLDAEQTLRPLSRSDFLVMPVIRRRSEVPGSDSCLPVWVMKALHHATSVEQVGSGVRGKRAGAWTDSGLIPVSLVLARSLKVGEAETCGALLHQISAGQGKQTSNLPPLIVPLKSTEGPIVQLLPVDCHTLGFGGCLFIGVSGITFFALAWPASLAVRAIWNRSSSASRATSPILPIFSEDLLSPQRPLVGQPEDGEGSIGVTSGNGGSSSAVTTRGDISPEGPREEDDPKDTSPKPDPASLSSDPFPEGPAFGLNFLANLDFRVALGTGNDPSREVFEFVEVDVESEGLDLEDDGRLEDPTVNAGLKGEDGYAVFRRGKRSLGEDEG